jgi:Uma2 family endonuclease
MLLSPLALLLLIEVADSSLPFDLSIKALLYARAGVRDYWVVDVQGRRIHVHRAPTASGYVNVHAYTEEESVALLLRPYAVSVVDNLLPPLKPSEAA